MAKKPLLYNEKNDKKQDAKLLKRVSPKTRAKFEKLDKGHKKVKYQKQDAVIDKKLLKKAKKK